MGFGLGTWKHGKPDYATLKPAAEAKPIDYPKPDGVISFDRLTNVAFSATNHEEDQMVHLQLKNPDIPIAVNLPTWDEPAQRYCPAGVYEVVRRRARRRASRSITRTASTARPATSRIRRRTSTGWCRRAGKGRTIPTCEAAGARQS